MFFGIFVSNRVSSLSFFVLIRVSIYQFLCYKIGCLFLDDKQQNFYKRLLINIRVKCLKQGIKKSEFCLKQGRKISDICLKQGQGMRGRAAPPHPGIYQVPPPDTSASLLCRILSLVLFTDFRQEAISYCGRQRTER